MLHLADLVVADRQVALPPGVARIGGGQLLGDRDAGLVARERGLQIALGLLHFADLFMADRQVALPPGIARIGRDQLLADRDAGLVARERRLQVAMGSLQVADHFVDDRQLALPPGVARIGGGQLLGDRDAGHVARERRLQVALGLLHAADHCVAGRQVALPPGVARIGGGQLLGDRDAGLVARERRLQVALGLLQVADHCVAGRQVALPPGAGRCILKRSHRGCAHPLVVPTSFFGVAGQSRQVACIPQGVEVAGLLRQGELQSPEGKTHVFRAQQRSLLPVELGGTLSRPAGTLRCVKGIAPEQRNGIRRVSLFQQRCRALVSRRRCGRRGGLGHRLHGRCQRLDLTGLGLSVSLQAPQPIVLLAIGTFDIDQRFRGPPDLRGHLCITARIDGDHRLPGGIDCHTARPLRVRHLRGRSRPSGRQACRCGKRQHVGQRGGDPIHLGAPCLTVTRAASAALTATPPPAAWALWLADGVGTEAVMRVAANAGSAPTATWASPVALTAVPPLAMADCVTAGPGAATTGVLVGSVFGTK